MAKKTHEKFLREVRELIEDEYIVLDQYSGSQNKVRFLHAKCGATFSMTPNRFLMGNRCPQCSGKMRKTTERFAQEVLEQGGGDYRLIGEYVNCHTKVELLHSRCQRTYLSSPNDFLNGRRCPHCNGSPKLTVQEVQERIAEVHGTDFILDGPYTGITRPLRLRHLRCNQSFQAASLQGFLQVARPCPTCDDRIRDTQWLQRKILYETNGEYELVGKYSYYTRKTDIRHVTCGLVYPVSPNHFFGMKTRCPICVRQERESRGVKKIKNELDQLGIQYQQEVEFKDCRRVRPLPFDFFVADRSLLIEFDGEQHYKPKFGKGTLVEQQERDRIKSEWAAKNGYTLLRIPYFEEDAIPVILSTTFND